MSVRGTIGSGLDARPGPRLVLLQLYHLGDVVLTTPAIRAARRAFPDAHIDFVAGLPGAEVLTGNRDLDHVHVWKRGLRSRVQLMRRIRAAHYDAAIDFHSSPSTAMMVAASGARIRIGLDARGPRTRAYTRLLPRERGPVYMALQKLRLLEPLGVDPEGADLRLDVSLDARDRAFAGEIWTRYGLGRDGAPVVAISPVSRHAFKQWGAERWAALADGLAEAGAHVLITSGPGQIEQAGAVAAAMRRTAVWRYGDTTVKQVAALYERCALWIGNDSGPKHLAVAVGAPTISVTRWRLGPVWSDTRPGSGQLAFDRAPPQGCDRVCRRCNHMGCLGAVTVEQVATAALARLQSVMSGRQQDRA